MKKEKKKRVERELKKESLQPLLIIAFANSNCNHRVRLVPPLPPDAGAPVPPPHNARNQWLNVWSNLAIASIGKK